MRRNHSEHHFGSTENNHEICLYLLLTSDSYMRWNKKRRTGLILTAAVALPFGNYCHAQGNLGSFGYTSFGSFQSSGSSSGYSSGGGSSSSGSSGGGWYDAEAAARRAEQARIA